ncbi:hypothetical protein GGG16DRAFT_86652, partial [Schizophyllum commune]
MRCAHPCAHSVLHALHTLALSPSSILLDFGFASHLSNSWIRIHGMGTMAVGSYTDAS